MTSAYAELLRRPGVARLVAAAVLGRLPIGIVAIAMVLLVQRATHSFASAGLVDAVFALGSAVAAPLLGRLVDRVGQTRVLLPVATVNALALALLVAAALNHTGVAPMALAAGVAGASVPPLSATMRALWPQLAGEGALVRVAFALESIAVEAFFILGPALCALLIALASPAAATLSAAALGLAGTWWFATSKPSRAWRPDAEAMRSRAGALASPGVRVMALAVTAEGLVFGILGVALPAFAVGHGAPAAAGWLLAAQAVGSALGGLWYGTRRPAGPLGRRFTTLFALFALGLAPLCLARSLGVMAVVLVLGGAIIAPLTAAGFELVDRLALPGTVTEAFTWLVTALTAGSAIGAAAGGVITQHAGSSWALASGAAMALLGPLVALTGRRALAGATVS